LFFIVTSSCINRHGTCAGGPH